MPLYVGIGEAPEMDETPVPRGHGRIDVSGLYYPVDGVEAMVTDKLHRGDSKVHMEEAVQLVTVEMGSGSEGCGINAANRLSVDACPQHLEDIQDIRSGIGHRGASVRC